MKEPKNILIVVLGAILIGGAGFYGGTLYQKSVTSKAVANGRAGGNIAGRGFGGSVNGAAGQRAGGMMGLRPVAGQIISKDDKSITVKLQDGSSRIIMLSSNTQISKAQVVDATGLAIGDTVRVFGTVNTDGSVTAQDIQLNPVQLPQGQNQPGQ